MLSSARRVSLAKKTKKVTVDANRAVLLCEMKHFCIALFAERAMQKERPPCGGLSF
jgi:hypothetical protein